MAHARSSGTATGRPLLALTALVVCWTGARVAMADWSQPLIAIERPPTRRQANTADPSQASSPARVVRKVADHKAGSPGLPVARVRLVEVRQSRGTTGRLPGVALTSVPSSWNGMGTPGSPAGSHTAGRSASGPAPSTGSAAPAPENKPEPARRWSADLWLALREGGGQLLGTAAAPVYGGSQSGAVVRYRLVAASPHEPAAYVRAVHALGRREGDLAAGLAARITPKLPVVAHVEARASRRGERVHLRQATAGLDDARLPLGIFARGYVQAGYVGGFEATGFADGHFIAERPLATVGRSALSTGAGIWGGAQHGSARLDLGPSVSLKLPLSGGSARLAIDYRYRVVGNAAPATGVALTLSASF
jgi:hypothetical protein